MEPKAETLVEKELPSIRFEVDLSQYSKNETPVINYLDLVKSVDESGDGGVVQIEGDQSEQQAIEIEPKSRWGTVQCKIDKIEKKQRTESSHSPPLPGGLSQEMSALISDLKTRSSEFNHSNRLKFFDCTVNSLLYRLEMKSRSEVAPMRRSRIYTHLAHYLPFTRGTIVARARALVAQNLLNPGTQHQFKHQPATSQPDTSRPELPDNLPVQIRDLILELKDLGDSRTENSREFFTENINYLLYRLDIMCRHELNKSVRSKVYTYLVDHFPCSKKSLYAKIRKMLPNMSPPPSPDRSDECDPSYYPIVSLNVGDKTYTPIGADGRKTAGEAHSAAEII